MIDLRNIAQQLRLPADQLRIAADMLEQGYQPAFIARYRADESGQLPGSVLWALKFAMEREHQLAAARKDGLSHLGEGVELDEEGTDRINHAVTTVDVDVALRCFRARRAAKQSGERAGQASQLLEKMIAASAPIDNLNSWVAEQLAIDASLVEPTLQQSSRLIGSLLSGDTRLMERMRRAVQKKATVRVEPLSEAAAAKAAKADKASDTVDGSSATGESNAEDTAAQHSADHDSHDSDAWAHDDDLVGDHEDSSEHTTESAEHTSEAREVAASAEQADSTQAPTTDGAPDGAPSETPAAEATDAVDPAISLSFDPTGKKRESKLSSKRKERAAAKAPAKLTPRQRRRRWLTSVLQPFKSLKKPLQRLTAYQMLMLGRGQRSQLIKVELDYDRRSLVNMARDVFVSEQHPLAKWFVEACENALQAGLYAKVEADALAEEDELAQQKLLEAATDQLRGSLLQRPVKGHRILIVDTVGPNSACVAIIDSRGKCLATQEVVCSSQPSVISQNVIMLGELVHKHKVTLVALSNGPARRFLIHTVAELMKQSASGNLRWTMVDRGGAEAYATSRQASVELPQLNRRFRAAVWLGRRLQDPLGELLKLDTSRLRLGSYQRELPQDPLKRLVTATLADCLCVRGVDARYASEQQFLYVPGVSAEVATKLSEMTAKREFVSREALVAALPDWSDAGKRQALGFVRIYNSPQTLDGTLIHPDDYRLAQRLIENTDLKQPDAAPAGWQPPKIKVPKAPKGSTQSADALASAAVGESAEPSTEAMATDATASETNVDASIEQSAPIENSTESPEVSAQSAEPSAEATAVSDSAEGSAAEASATDGESAGSDQVGGESASSESLPEIAPEYPEDVLAQQAVAPTIDVEKLARGWQVGRAKLGWLAQCLANPFGDTRDRRPPIPMLASVPTLNDLQPGMCVYAIVVGVADFGAFVELGPDCGGLIHISRLSARYVEDPHQAVQIGDLIQAWVVSVDVEKRRVALTALSPQQQQRQAEAQREQEQARQESRSHRPSGQQGNRQGGGNREGQRSGPARGGQPGQPRTGAPSGAGRSDQGGRPSSGDGGRGGRGGQRRGGDGGRGQGSRSDNKAIVVKSKKPSAPITEAMKKGQEPLRSFSDLLQFYEVKRTDVPADAKPETPPAAPAPESTDTPENS